MFIYRLMLVVCLSAATVSCSVMRSAPNNADKPTSYHSGGTYTLPMTMMKLTVRIDDKDDAVTVDKPELERVPDGKMLFNLDYLADITSDDSFKVELDDKGFLKQVTVAADDKKGPIIKVIASTVLTLMTGIPVPVTGLKEGEMRSIRVNRGGILLQQTINPNNLAELCELNAKLLKYDLRVDVEEFGTDDRNNKQLPETNDSSNRSGIFYRPLLPYKVSISTYDRPKKEWEVFNAYVIQTENISPLISVDISRSYFVKRETTLMFNTGVLTSTEVKKPSEVLGLVKIPLEIATAIVGIPQQLLQFRIDYSSKQTSLLQNQKKLIEAQQNLLDAIEKAKTTPTPAGTNNQTTPPPTEGSNNQRDGD